MKNTESLYPHPRRHPFFGVYLPALGLTADLFYWLIETPHHIRLAVAACIGLVLASIITIHYIHAVSDWFHNHNDNQHLLHEKDDARTRRVLYVILLLIGYCLPALVMVTMYSYIMSRNTLSIPEIILSLLATAFSTFIFSEASHTRAEDRMERDRFFNAKNHHD